MIYTTNAVESLNRSLRKIIKTRELRLAHTEKRTPPSASTSLSATCRPASASGTKSRTPLLLHQPELARQITRRLSCDRRADLGYHHQDRPHRALRTRHQAIPQRYCRIGRRDGRHQTQT